MKLTLASLAGAALFVAAQSHAAVLIEIIETRTGVEATLSGNFATEVVKYVADTQDTINGFAPTSGSITIKGSTAGAGLYSSVATLAPFGGGIDGVWDLGTGDAFAMVGVPGTTVVALPKGYVSGDPLQGFSSKNNSSFTSLGFTPGTYVTTFVNQIESTPGNFITITDTVTLVIGGVSPVVVNNEISLGSISNKSFTRTADTTYPSESTAGVYRFTATFCGGGAGANDLSGLLARTKNISAHASLVSRDTPTTVGSGGIDSEQLFPTTGDYADGVLSGNECVDVTFKIGLTKKKRFSFNVDIWGTSQAPGQL